MLLLPEHIDEGLNSIGRWYPESAGTRRPEVARRRHCAPAPGAAALRRSPAISTAYVCFFATQRLHLEQQTWTPGGLEGST
jgi:hypothetical protein